VLYHVHMLAAAAAVAAAKDSLYDDRKSVVQQGTSFDSRDGSTSAVVSDFARAVPATQYDKGIVRTSTYFILFNQNWYRGAARKLTIENIFVVNSKRNRSTWAVCSCRLDYYFWERAVQGVAPRGCRVYIENNVSPVANILLMLFYRFCLPFCALGGPAVLPLFLRSLALRES